MSAILAVCGEAFCAMVSDGRVVEEPINGAQPKVISEDVPKVRKVNRNVLVGFAGDTLAAVQIINALDEYETQYLTLEKVVKILRQKAPSVRVQPVGCACWWAAATARGSLCSPRWAVPNSTCPRPSPPGRAPT